MDRKEIVKFINENNVGLDRGAGLIAAFEAFAAKVIEAEKAKREVKFVDVYPQ